jgi:hypothetical protein
MITEIENGKLCQGRVLSNTKTRFEKFFTEFVKDNFICLHMHMKKIISSKAGYL